MVDDSHPSVSEVVVVDETRALARVLLLLLIDRAERGKWMLKVDCHFNF